MVKPYKGEFVETMEKDTGKIYPERVIRIGDMYFNYSSIRKFDRDYKIALETYGWGYLSNKQWGYYEDGEFIED